MSSTASGTGGKPTTRLTRLLVLTGIVIGLLALDWTYKQQKAAEVSLASAQARLTKASALRGQTEWLEAAARSTAVVDAVLVRVPEAESQGRAVAATQAWVSELVRSTDPALRVQAASPQYIDDGVDERALLVVQMTLSGPLEPRRALGVVGRVESRQQLTRIDALEIRALPSPQFSMTFSTLYRITPELSP